MWSQLTVIGLFAWPLAAVAASQTNDLEKPIQIMAVGEPIDIECRGLSAPFVGDLDGDGLSDLLVGQLDQRREGRLRIYRNLGTNMKPRFEGFVWFHNGAETGRIPAG